MESDNSPKPTGNSLGDSIWESFARGKPDSLPTPYPRWSLVFNIAVARLFLSEEERLLRDYCLERWEKDALSLRRATLTTLGAETPQSGASPVLSSAPMSQPTDSTR